MSVCGARARTGTLDWHNGRRLVETLVGCAGEQVVHAHEREAITRNEEDARLRVLVAHRGHLVPHVTIRRLKPVEHRRHVLLVWRPRGRHARPLEQPPALQVVEEAAPPPRPVVRDGGRVEVELPGEVAARPVLAEDATSNCGKCGVRERVSRQGCGASRGGSGEVGALLAGKGQRPT